MYEPAVAEYEKFIQQNPTSTEIPSARFRAADCYFFLKDYRKASFYFDAFLKEFPSDSRSDLAQFRLGSAYFLLGKSGDATHTLTKLLITSKDEAIRGGAVFYLAKTQNAASRSRRGQALLAKLLKNYPQSEYASYAGVVMGDSFLKEGRFDDALNAYQIAASNKEPADLVSEASLKIAETYFQIKDYKKARDAYEIVQKLPNSEAWLEDVTTGLFYCEIYLKNPSSAKKIWEENESLLLKSHDGASMAQGAALIYFADKNYPKALELFNQCRPTDTVLYKKAACLAALGQKNETQAVLERLAREYPKSEFTPRALLELSQIYMDVKDYERAAEFSKELVERFPKNEWVDLAHYKQGVALTALGRPKEALLSFEEILLGNPFSKLYAESLYGAAVCAKQLKDTPKEQTYLEQFLKATPTHALAVSVKSRLAVLYFDAQTFDSAAEIVKEALLQNSKIEITSNQALWLCQYLLDHSDYDVLTKALAEIPKRFPSENLQHEIDFLTAENWMGLKKPKTALEFYDKSIGDNASGKFVAHAYLGLGVANAAEGRFSNAEVFFNKALGFQKETAVSARARFELASLRLREGQTEEAAKAFMLVAVLYDDAKYSSIALYKAGECFTASGQIENAEHAFEELKNRYPKSEWAKKAEGFNG